LGQRKGLDRSSEEAGRDKVVLARGVAVEGSPLPAAEDVEFVEPPCGVVKYDVLDVGDGMREELGVLIGVLSALE
jgi:hypothetical protein